MKAAATSMAIGVLVLAGLEGCDKTRQKKVQPPVQSVSVGKQTIAGRKKWRPSDFFTSANELRICEAVSAGDIEELTSLVKSGAELNTPGKYGVTVLFWAFFEEDMLAFKVLLEHGADPDLRLNDEFDEAQLKADLAPGDSVLFTSLRYFKPRFCLAALEHSRDANQSDRHGQNLLYVFLQPGSGGQENLKALLDAGIDLNAQGKYGSTPCHRALRLANPGLCIQLLQAGADPSIQNDEGHDLADSLERLLANLANVGKSSDYLNPIVTWLSENYREIRKAPTFVDAVPEDGRAR